LSIYQLWLTRRPYRKYLHDPAACMWFTCYRSHVWGQWTSRSTWTWTAGRDMATHIFCVKTDKSHDCLCLFFIWSGQDNDIIVSQCKDHLASSFPISKDSAPCSPWLHAIIFTRCEGFSIRNMLLYEAHMNATRYTRVSTIDFFPHGCTSTNSTMLTWWQYDTEVRSRYSTISFSSTAAVSGAMEQWDAKSIFALAGERCPWWIFDLVL